MTKKPAIQLEPSSYIAAGKLKGKVALITGGDSGIGAATAILFAREGADVAIGYLGSAKDAQTIAGRIEHYGCILAYPTLDCPLFHAS